MKKTIRIIVPLFAIALFTLGIKYSKDIGMSLGILKEPESIESLNLVANGPPIIPHRIQEITISAVGDMTLGFDQKFQPQGRFDQVINGQYDKYNYSLKNVRHIFEEDDVTIANLETTLTNSNTKNTRKNFAFKGEPEYARILSQNSIEVATLANNHMHDYGVEGFEDTVKNLENVGVIPIGTDLGYSKSNEYGGELTYDFSEIVESKGVKIGLLAYKGWDMEEVFLEKLESDIKRLKEEADIVTVSYHWGNEGTHEVNHLQKKLGKYTIDCGADMVIGHHPHVLQGIEKYKGRYIVYSLGNFVFGGNRNPSDKETMIYQNTFTVNLTRDRIENVEETIIPARISSVNNLNNYQAIILEGKEKTKLREKIDGYSNSLYN